MMSIRRRLSKRVVMKEKSLDGVFQREDYTNGLSRVKLSQRA